MLRKLTVKQHEKIQEVLGYIAYAFILMFVEFVIIAASCYPEHTHWGMFYFLTGGTIISGVAYLILRYA